MPSVKKGNLSIAPKKSTKAPAKKATTAKITVKKTVAKKATSVKTTVTTKKNTATKKSTTTTAKKSNTTKPKTKKNETKSKVISDAEKLYQSYRKGNDDHKFEIFCENYLWRHRDKYGDVKIKRKSKDGGLDIVCIKTDDYDSVEKVFYVQVKNKKVGVDVVRELIGSMSIRSKKYGDDETEHIGVIMTSLTVSADAKKEGKASPYSMKYIEGTTLAKEERFD